MSPFTDDTHSATLVLRVWGEQESQLRQGEVALTEYSKQSYITFLSEIILYSYENHQCSVRNTSIQFVVCNTDMCNTHTYQGKSNDGFGDTPEGDQAVHPGTTKSLTVVSTVDNIDLHTGTFKSIASTTPMSDSITGGPELSKNATVGINDIFNEEDMANADRGMHCAFGRTGLVLGLLIVSLVDRQLSVFQVWQG